MTVLERIAGFLNGIGIETRPGDVDAHAFLPGVAVAGGSLVYDAAALRWPGDLLHEAGHIAVTPGDLRAQLGGNIDALAGVPHATEVEATAWAHAAAVHLQLPLDVLFHEGGYRGRSQDLIRTYSLGVYPGAFGLAQAGMTFVGPQAVAAGHLVYPRMARWLRA